MSLTKEKVGTLEVLASNSILVDVGRPVEISFGEIDPLKFTFNIINDPNKDNYTSEARLINEKSIELDLFNFVSEKAGSGGTIHPVKVGNYQNRALYYSLVIISNGSVQPLFIYTFYLGEEVKNGE
jgi:hypothetical protein